MVDNNKNDPFLLRNQMCDCYISNKLIESFDDLYSEFRHCVIHSAPVIRLFGSSASGQTCCVHVHRVYPYLTVDVDGDHLPSHEFLCAIADSLDAALNSSFARTSTNNQQQQQCNKSVKQFVYKIVPLFQKPFYGYHEREKPFLKIYFYSPFVLKRAAELLQNGAVMGWYFQPHELHLPYILQFFIDFCIYGMDVVHLRNVRFRRRSSVAAASASPREQQRLLLDNNLQKQDFVDVEQLPNVMLLDVAIARQSCCDLELDCVADDILNPNLAASERLRGGGIQNPGLRFIWNDERQRRRNQGFESSQIETPESQDRGEIPPTESEVYFLEILNKQLQSSCNLSEKPAMDDATSPRGSSWCSSNSQSQHGNGVVNEDVIGQLCLSQSSAEHRLQAEQQLHLSQLDEEDLFLQKLITDLEAEELAQQPSAAAVAEVAFAADLSHCTPALQLQRSLTSVKATPCDATYAQGLVEETDAAALMNADDDSNRMLLVHAGDKPEEEEEEEERRESLEMSQLWMSDVEEEEESADSASSDDVNKSTTAVASVPIISSGFSSTLDILPKLPTSPLLCKPCLPMAKRRKLLPVQSLVSANKPPIPKCADAGNIEESAGNHLKLQKKTFADFFVDSRNVVRLRSNRSQLDGPSIDDSFGFDISFSALHQAAATSEIYCLCVLSVELHVDTRASLRPDPEFDPVCAIVYSVYRDNLPPGKQMASAALLLASVYFEPPIYFQMNTKYFASEVEMLEEFCRIVSCEDPDIICGYEIQMLSWGYLFERADHLKIANFGAKISRVPEATNQSGFSSEDDWWAMSDLRIVGRIVLNVWRLLRHQLTLDVYSFENAVFNLLKRRTPWYSFQTLTSKWRQSVTSGEVLSYYRKRSQGNIELMLHCDILGRCSELAKLYGIQFSDVISRGSQFRVESMMFRMTRQANFIGVSPSILQVRKMAAPECIPLTMEPVSGLYEHPVLVLDFQSLYPSIVIAYNYCYSTCLGKIKNLLQSRDGFIEFGCHRLAVSVDTYKKLLEDIHISPAGVGFVKSNIRRGILPQMLEEILATRLMVKATMKGVAKDNRSLWRLLNFRQLGLKLIANVTYGYTSANFSGRMPCVEIADSIAHKGRETLERAIKLVNSYAEWKARVVYGDTDSLFVSLPGRTKEEAFAIGEQIAAAVTAINPKPVKLKFEKVYFPCILETKKRYVGYSYESVDQKKPIFDAKGIETVRRDSCSAVSKVLEQSLHVLFRTLSLSAVQSYVLAQLKRIMLGRVTLREFVFAKEYRGRRYYKPGAVLPTLHLAKKAMSVDRRAEPRIGERVRYVVCCGAPNSTLISGVLSAEQVCRDERMRVNTRYYIIKQLIPALQRAVGLCGVDIQAWFMEMPKFSSTSGLLPIDCMLQSAATIAVGFGGGGQQTLSQYYQDSRCMSCGRRTTTVDIGKQQVFCIDCSTDRQQSVLTLQCCLECIDRQLRLVWRLCDSCCGCKAATAVAIACESLDCAVYFKRMQLLRDAAGQQRRHLWMRHVASD